MRSIGLDVHQSSCEVAIHEAGETRSAGRISTDRSELELFAQSLGPTDQVALEATGPAFEIARILAPHVARVVVANAAEVRAISHARVKSDRFDARTLARLLDAGMLEAVWVPSAEIGALRRRVARRAALVRQRVRAKNESHAVLARCLLGRAPASDLFGAAGRQWLDAQRLPDEETETVRGCLRQIDFLESEIEAIDRRLCEWALGSEDAKRLMSIPGVGVGAAVTLMAAIGEVSRFETPRKLVAYLGLDPKVRQSGEGAPRHGRISGRGNAQARSVLVEAAWTAVRSPGPLRAFGQRIRARRGAQVAAVAVARKLAVLAWHLLSKGEDYAFGRPSLLRAKLRQAERVAGAPRLSTRHGGPRISANAAERKAERELAERAEVAYRRLLADWKASGQVKERAPARHRGAHLLGRLHGKQRGRTQPQILRFSSSSGPTPTTDSCKWRCKRQSRFDFPYRPATTQPNGMEETRSRSGSDQKRGATVSLPLRLAFALRPLTMQIPDDIRRDLPPDLEGPVAESLAATAVRLQAQRPNPAPSFRGDLRRRLLGKSSRRQHVAARRGARALAFSYAASGLVLLAIAAIGLAGAGPFAPS